MRPALESVSGTPRGAPDIIAYSSAEELFQSARRVEKLLAVMFGAAPPESRTDQVPSQLLSSLTQLRARVDAYDRLRSNK